MLKSQTLLHKNKAGNTMYLVVPANVVMDEQFPFPRKTTPVVISVNPEEKTITIRADGGSDNKN